MSESDIKRQVASLNTQLRFGRHDGALTEAYKLRSQIQLSGLATREILGELERAEKIISRLESDRLVGVQKLISRLVGVVTAALNPEDATESTLLDDFSEPAAADHEESLETATDSPSAPGLVEQAWPEEPAPEDEPEPEFDPAYRPTVAIGGRSREGTPPEPEPEPEDDQDWGWGSS